MQATVTLLQHTPNPEQLIERAGRVAYKSEDKITKDSSSKFCQMLLRAGHESVFEHAHATFQLDRVSRALTHQLVRHRLAAYTQESQRYVYQDGFDFVTPPSLEKVLKGLDSRKVSQYRNHMLEMQSFYNRLVEAGVPKEDARFILPNAACTKIVCTANFRQWRHMIKMRGSQYAQWEIREVFVEILRQLWEVAPNVFGDFQVKLTKDKEHVVQDIRS